MMHIISLKSITKEKTIEKIEDSPIFYLPLYTVAGSTPEPHVKEGDKVLKYQLLASSPKGFSAPVYSPVSGIVKKIGLHPEKGNKSLNTIYIENDFRENETKRFSAPHLQKGELIEFIEKAGIIGQGGAGFPTALKYKIKDKKVKTFIVNGAECEPFLTADYAVMAQRTSELMEGIKIINQILEAEEIVIAIEEQNKELEKRFEPYNKKENSFSLRTEIVPDEYPQGGELQLIKSVTGIELRKGTVPIEAGIVMNNINTIYAIRQAVFYGRPVINRILTLSGNCKGKCGNYEVKVGTPVSHILKQTQYSIHSSSQVIMGGPMMGTPVEDLSTPISQRSNGILVLSPALIHPKPCIRCGYCVNVCPMYLVPFKYDEFFRSGKFEGMIRYNLEDCIECASCEYICPSKVPLMKSIFYGKKYIKQKQNEKNKV